MRRFLLHIALFSLPFWVFWGYLSFSEMPRDHAYELIQKDCRSGSWIYQRLYENPKPLDLALVGTSRTMCALEDDVMQAYLRDSLDREWEVSNFGVCRNGVNLHQIILRDILMQKKPKSVVVEVHTKMPPNSHMHFPMLGNASDVYWPKSFMNSSVLPDISTFTWTRLSHWREQVLGIDFEYPEELTDPDHSFMRVPDDITADASEMEKVLKRRSATTGEYPEGIEGIWQSITDHFPRAYYRSMAEMCKEAGVQLYFLYLPGYGTCADRPQEWEFYESLAPVLLPPSSIFSNPDHFFDPDHLNQKGARMLTEWLAQEVSGRTIHDPFKFP